MPVSPFFVHLGTADAPAGYNCAHRSCSYHLRPPEGSLISVTSRFFEVTVSASATLLAAEQGNRILSGEDVDEIGFVPAGFEPFALDADLGTGIVAEQM